MYDLAGKEEERRFSPNCWRVRFALLHKELPFEAVPWRFIEKERIAFSGQERVPVIVDGEQALSDSWTIACYLEETYPDRPPLFVGGRAVAHFFTTWAEQVLHTGIFPMVVADIHAHLHPKDQDYFRTSREMRLGAALEAVAADREVRVLTWRNSLAPLRTALSDSPFLAGAAPAWPDYVTFSPFLWARSISPFVLLAPGDPLLGWHERMLNAFNGASRLHPGYDGPGL